jgi:hypothetical protein
MCENIIILLNELYLRLDVAELELALEPGRERDINPMTAAILAGSGYL